MTQKRFRKLMMSTGYSRNTVNAYIMGSLMIFDFKAHAGRFTRRYTREHSEAMIDIIRREWNNFRRLSDDTV